MSEVSQLFASIITIGDELLIGQVIDTNSAWIAQELNKVGISVKHRIAVGDVWEDIWQSLDEESKQAQIIIITGGLGPTADDITKPLLCQYFGGKLVSHQPSFDFITNLFENVLKRPMIDRNRKQADVPDVCTVLLNEVGTAPGMLFEKEGTIFISLPGVPHEMKWLMQNHVLAILEQKFERPFIEHRTLLTSGVGESFLADLIADFENALPPFIKLAYLPNHGMVRLRLTAIATNKALMLAELTQQFSLLKIAVKEYLLLDEDVSLQSAVGKLLTQNGQTIATAESCTGGYIAHLFTAMSGSSAYFKGGIVSYHNAIKTKLLGVTETMLTEFGAVSEQTVIQMATQVMQVVETDYAIAVSGIMGPTGATEGKPIGTVWIAVANKYTVKTKLFNFRYDRERNIHFTAVNAINMVRQLIVDNR